MRRLEDNPHVRWFKLAMYLGILANLLFALPAIFAPYWLLRLFGLPWTKDVIWLRDAGGLLFFLSLMYLGAAREPFRYRLNARLAVLGRIAFAAFWFWMVFYADLPRAFLALGIGDAIVAIIQVVTYVLMMRHEYLQPEVPEDAVAGAA